MGISLQETMRGEVELYMEKEKKLLVRRNISLRTDFLRRKKLQHVCIVIRMGHLRERNL